LTNDGNNSLAENKIKEKANTSMSSLASQQEENQCKPDELVECQTRSKSESNSVRRKLGKGDTNVSLPQTIRNKIGEKPNNKFSMIV